MIQSEFMKDFQYKNTYDDDKKRLKTKDYTKRV